MLTSFLLYAFVYGRIPVRLGVDAIVALGSGLRGSRVPPLLASRLDRASALYRAEVAAGNQPVVITSGGRGPGEDRSTTTEENLRFSKELAGQGARMVVVTNNFHVLRAATLARHLRLDAEVVGSPTARYYPPSAASILPLAVLAGGY